MQVTIDIDEDVLNTAERIATESEQSVGGVISQMARLGMAGPPKLIIDEMGLPVLALRPGEKPTVTSELVRAILDSEE